MQNPKERKETCERKPLFAAADQHLQVHVLKVQQHIIITQVNFVCSRSAPPSSTYTTFKYGTPLQNINMSLQSITLLLVCISNPCQAENIDFILIFKLILNHPIHNMWSLNQIIFTRMKYKKLRTQCTWYRQSLVLYFSLWTSYIYSIHSQIA